MPQLSTKSGSLSDQLLNALSGFRNLLVVTHDNPDPDAIATGWVILTLIQERLQRPARLIAGGAIVRAENRQMVELLQPPIQLVNQVEMPEGTATTLVDCQLGASNHLLTRCSVRPVAVVDHHQNGARAPDVMFYDVRPTVAASASIATSYLQEQGVEPGVKLATALLYAIRTETRGTETYYSDLDRSILPWLTEQADPALLAEIESAPLSREYYGDLVLAMQNTFVYEDAALCLLPRASGAEIVGEVADLLIRCEGVRRVLCGAAIESDLLLSVRTERDDESAAKLLQLTLDGIGGGGGHAHRAGGKIAGVAEKGRITEQLHEELCGRWISACHVDRHHGSRLIARQEIVQNLRSSVIFRPT